MPTTCSGKQPQPKPKKKASKAEDKNEPAPAPAPKKKAKHKSKTSRTTADKDAEIAAAPVLKATGVEAIPLAAKTSVAPPPCSLHSHAKANAATPSTPSLASAAEIIAPERICQSDLQSTLSSDNETSEIAPQKWKGKEKAIKTEYPGIGYPQFDLDFDLQFEKTFGQSDHWEMPVDESSDKNNEEDDEDEDDEDDDEDEAAMVAHDAADYVDENDRGEEEDNFEMYVEEENELDVMSSQMEDKLDINHIPANGSSKTTGGHIHGRALGNSAKMADLAHMDIHQEPEPLMGLVQVYLASENITLDPNSNPPLTSFVIPSMSSLAAVLEAILQNHLPALKGCNPLVHVWTSFGHEGAPFWLSYGILDNIDSPKYHSQSWFVDQSSSTYMLYVSFQTTLLSTPASSTPVSASSQVSSHPSFSVAAASSSSSSASPHTTTIAKSSGSISDDAIIAFLNLDPDLAEKPSTRSPITAVCKMVGGPSAAQSKINHQQIETEFRVSVFRTQKTTTSLHFE
ncbi:hypothetical protein BJ165DRAFT_1535738 [Panaeolus papilionaceus]|nr:hypothetical protein BJ165DRAFT_1535738 [Panaeolus papilionaceus]